MKHLRFIYLFFACSVTTILLTGCGNRPAKKTALSERPDWPNQGCLYKVQQVIETDHALLSPEELAYTDKHFDEMKLVDWQMRYKAEDMRVAEDSMAEDGEYDFYYDAPWVEAYENAEDGEDYPHEMRRYDEDGFLILKAFYRDSNQIPLMQRIARDKNHRILKDEWIRDDSLESYTDYSYNADGFMTRSYYWTNDGNSSESRYTYDRKNYLLRKDEYRCDTFVAKVDYTYDKQGNLIVEEMSGLWNHKWVYDPKPQKASEPTPTTTEWNPLVIRRDTIYGANGKMKMTQTYLSLLTDEGQTPEQLASREMWYYDEHENWVRYELYYFMENQPPDDHGLLMGLKTRDITYYDAQKKQPKVAKTITVSMDELHHPDQYYRDFDNLLITQLHYDETVRPMADFYAEDQEYASAKSYYDADDKVLKREFFSPASTEPDAYMLYDYNADGKCIKTVLYNAANEVELLCYYQYNEAGQQTVREAEPEYASYDRTEFRYDKNGHLSEEISYLPPEGLYVQNRHIYTYDEKGFCTQETILEYLPDGSCDTLETYTYVNDERGNHIKRIHTWYYGEEQDIDTYAYNEDNQEIVHEWFYDKLRERKETKYHSNGNKYVATYFTNGQEVGHTCYNWDWKRDYWTSLSFNYIDKQGKTHIVGYWTQEIK